MKPYGMDSVIYAATVERDGIAKALAEHFEFLASGMDALKLENYVPSTNLRVRVYIHEDASETRLPPRDPIATVSDGSQELCL